MKVRSRSNSRFVRLPCRDLQYVVVLVTILAIVWAPLTWADRTQLSPGWNMFSPQQDIEVGKQVSHDAEQQLQLLNDAQVDSYLNNLGRALAAHAPGERFPYQYKCVNDRVINAFALPGGFIYINRGAIEAADNEAQLAGVMAHETSHVALRHGTNQASKASVAQLPLGVLGGMLGSNSTGSLLAQLGGGLVTKSILLKYSRTDESQADIMGTQILFDSGYDPRAMAQFFEKIEAENKGGQPLEFFSDHPNPDHRIERVDEEIDKLGGAKRGWKTDSPAFQQIKRYVLSRPAPAAKSSAQASQGYTQSRDQARLGISGLRILAASYGARDRFSDVRQLLQSRIQNDRLNLPVSNASMGGDPIVGVPKSLRISYAWGGRTYDVEVPENQMVSLPAAQQPLDADSVVRSGVSGLRILAASYGARDRFSDVRQLLQSRIQNDRLNLQVGNASMGGDPIVGVPKSLRISYAWGGKTYEAVIPEDQTVSIPAEQHLKDVETLVQKVTPLERPSTRLKILENSALHIEYPDNWLAYGQGDVVTIAPRGGLVDDSKGNKALAYGVMVNIYEPEPVRQDHRQLPSEGYRAPSRMSLEEATDRLVQGFQQSNRNMRVIRHSEATRVGGQSALSTYLSNDSPLGGTETEWLVTLQRPEGLLFIIFTAPERDFSGYQRVFQQMVNSVRMR